MKLMSSAHDMTSSAVYVGHAWTIWLFRGIQKLLKFKKGLPVLYSVLNHSGKRWEHERSVAWTKHMLDVCQCFTLHFFLLRVIYNNKKHGQAFLICCKIVCTKAYLPLFVACMAGFQRGDKEGSTFLVFPSPSPVNARHAGYIVYNVVVKIKLQ